MMTLFIYSSCHMLNGLQWNSILFLIVKLQLMMTLSCVCSRLEIEYSGRRRELRFHYLHKSRLRTEVFRLDKRSDVDLADTRWHVVAVGLTAASHIRIHIDCQPVYERRLPVTVCADDWLSATGGGSQSTLPGSSPSRNGRTSSLGDDDNSDVERLRAWIGQRNDEESKLKVGIVCYQIAWG